MPITTRVWHMCILYARCVTRGVRQGQRCLRQSLLLEAGRSSVCLCTAPPLQSAPVQVLPRCWTDTVLVTPVSCGRNPSTPCDVWLKSWDLSEYWGGRLLFVCSNSVCSCLPWQLSFPSVPALTQCWHQAPAHCIVTQRSSVQVTQRSSVQVTQCSSVQVFNCSSVCLFQSVPFQTDRLWSAYTKYASVPELLQRVAWPVTTSNSSTVTPEHLTKLSQTMPWEIKGFDQRVSKFGIQKVTKQGSNNLQDTAWWCCW